VQVKVKETTKHSSKEKIPPKSVQAQPISSAKALAKRIERGLNAARPRA
jgi:hypothetical protein